MSEITASSIEQMKYNELKSKAAELGLDASGTKEDLIARLTAHVGGDAPVAPAPAAPEASNTEAPAAPVAPVAPETPQKPVLSEAQERVEQSKADKALREGAREMKAALDKQPKVSIMIPFEAGENPEQGKKVPFHVNLNGYAMDLPRGQYIDVPQQVADIIKERLESEGKIGAQWRIDRDPNKSEALA